MIEQIDYTYDANGRRTSRTLLNASGGTPETPMNAVYDTANRMTQVTLSAGATSRTYSLTYDDNGNLVRKQNIADGADVTTYTWDARNRLAALNRSGPNGAAQAGFSYDAGGRRIGKTVTTSAGTDSVQYVYEGVQAIGEVRSGQMDASYIAVGLDDVVARVLSAASSQAAAPQVKTYLADALGSIMAQARADQSLEVGYAYSPYGETGVAGVEQGAPNTLQYTGRENDRTGLYYYRARYYDPVLKRFISQDPIGLEGGVNVFAYVENDPVSYTDPEGLKGGGAYHTPMGRPQYVPSTREINRHPEFVPPKPTPSFNQHRANEFLEFSKQGYDFLKGYNKHHFPSSPDPTATGNCVPQLVCPSGAGANSCPVQPCYYSCGPFIGPIPGK